MKDYVAGWRPFFIVSNLASPVTRAIEDGKPYDEAAFEACLAASVGEVVQQQADTGIDVVSDGEFSKGANWAFYVHKRLSGITVRPATSEEARDPMASMGGGRDHQAFPEFYAEYDAASGLAKRLGNRVVVNGPITYSDNQVLRDIRNLKAAVAKAEAKHPSLEAFLPVVAPASALPGRELCTFPHAPLMGVTRIGGLEGIMADSHLQHEIDDLFERHVESMRPVPAAPANVIAREKRVEMIVGDHDDDFGDGSLV